MNTLPINGNSAPPLAAGQGDGASQSESAPPKLLLSAAEAAAALGIGLRTLWSLTASREIACVRIGRLVRYDVKDLERYIDRNRQSPRR